MKIDFVENAKTPGILIAPEISRGGVLVVHGYGGCKEEIAGLSLRIAAFGFSVYTIDSQGHGENTNPLDNSVAQEISDCIKFCRQFGRVTAIGHSLGGRLVLTSSADFTIGISPALANEYGPHTQSFLKNLRQYRVIENYPNILFDILRSCSHKDNMVK